jgi:hypothetical protein
MYRERILASLRTSLASRTLGLTGEAGRAPRAIPPSVLPRGADHRTFVALRADPIAPTTRPPVE